MKTTKIALALAGLAFVTLAAAAPATASDTTYCMWNHDVVKDQYVEYTGLFYQGAGVRFEDGPICGVRIVCYGDVAWCNFPKIP